MEGDWDKLPKAMQDQINLAMREKTWPIYICGETGRGKTFAMASAYLRCQSARVHWIDFQPWLKRVMDARRGEGSEHWMFEQIKDAFLLCIDDCGIRSDSEAQHSVFLEILNLRKDKATIITGNHEPNQLHKVFDSRIASRLMSGVILRLTGKDRRMVGTKIVEISAT